MRHIKLLIFLCAGCLLVGCSKSGKPEAPVTETGSYEPDSNPDSMLGTEPDPDSVSGIMQDEKSTSGIVTKYLPLPNGNVVRIYVQECDGEHVPLLTHLDVYDPDKGETIASEELLEYNISSLPSLYSCGASDNGFYLYARSASTFLIYSLDGTLQQMLQLPQCIGAVCIADDFSKVAYQKEPYRDEESADEKASLALMDVASKKEEILYVTRIGAGEVHGFTGLFFNKDHTRIGFSGNTFPEGGKDSEESVDCYGCIDLADNSIHIAECEKKTVEGCGNDLIIYDISPEDIHQETSGIIGRYHMDTGELTEISTAVANESQQVYAVDSNTFFTVLGGIDGGDTTIRRYEGNTVVDSFQYRYPEGTSPGFNILYDKERDRYYIELYDDAILNYRVDIVERN